ncbi:hypothetical protein RQN30_09460 [Arcanobacterium hippocoleae]
MKSQLIYLKSLRSQRIVYALLLLFSLIITAQYTTQEKSFTAMNHILDLLPMLVGCCTTAAIASFRAEGMLYLHLLRYPNRRIVLLQTLGAAVLYASAIMCTIFFVCFAESCVILLVSNGEAANPQVIFPIAIRFFLLLIAFSAVGAAIGIIGRTTALSLTLYVSIIWILPIVLVFLSLIRKGLDTFASQYTIVTLSVNFAFGSFSQAAIAYSYFAIWIGVLAVLAYLGLKSDR